VKIDRWSQSRYWAVYDDDGQLVCVTVYKKGAKEVVRRLTQLDPRNCPRCGFLSETKQSRPNLPEIGGYSTRADNLKSDICY
jgi:hypothetical protein